MTSSALDQLLGIDRTVHEPARLRLMVQLSAVEEADFVYLVRTTGLTDGNISSHMARLQEAGYATISKGYVGNRPRTIYSLTGNGRSALTDYLTVLRDIATAVIPT